MMAQIVVIMSASWNVAAHAHLITLLTTVSLLSFRCCHNDCPCNWTRRATLACPFLSPSAPFRHSRATLGWGSVGRMRLLHSGTHLTEMCLSTSLTATSCVTHQELHLSEIHKGWQDEIFSCDIQSLIPFVNIYSSQTNLLFTMYGLSVYMTCKSVSVQTLHGYQTQPYIHFF